MAQSLLAKCGTGIFAGGLYIYMTDVSIILLLDGDTPAAGLTTQSCPDHRQLGRDANGVQPSGAVVLEAVGMKAVIEAVVSALGTEFRIS